MAFDAKIGRLIAHQASGSSPSSPFLRSKNYIGRPYHTTTKEPFLCNLRNSGEQKMSQHNFNDNVNCFNTNIFNDMRNIVVDERSEILAWLSPLEPRIRHHEIQTRRVDEVGDWLMQTQEYRNWFDGIRTGGSDDSVLFCYGGPGVGKTYISSLVIDALCKQTMGRNAAVACFYFDFATQDEQSPVAVLGSVLKQAVGGLDEIPEGIVEAFRGREKVIGGKRLMLSEIVEFLQDISSLRSTFMCIDALDECPAGNRAKLLDSLKQILWKSPGARIFLTGRPHIRGEVEKYLAGRAATRSITPTKGDIIIFLRVKLKEDTTPDAMDENLEEEIIKSIPETVSEIFLLVFLSIETILQETTIHRRRQKLRAMKNGLNLGSAYKATLKRIQAQGGDRTRLGMATLMWISHSARPLQADEICHALAIEVGSTDLNSDAIPAITTLISCCQGLVTIDKATSTVRLIHFTLQEYLCTHPDLFDRAHSTMAEICLTYLNFRSVKDLSARPPPDPRDTPFLGYSSLYWGIHARVELSDCAEAAALRLLDRFDDHISAEILWNSICRFFFGYRTPGGKPFSALHCISYFGIAELASILVKMKRWDVNQRDNAGMTPLIWAARYGHEEVVGLLLREKRIHPDQQDTIHGRTALSWAAKNGHEGVVRLFLGPGFANPGSIGRRWGKAPQVVGLVFGRRYVNPDSSDQCGRTPLSLAAESGCEGIVKLLLERKGVNPDKPGNWGLAPVSWAAQNGYEGIVKLLLEREDVSPDTPDTKCGRTPLLCAASSGYEGIVKLLLERKDVNPNIPETVLGRTPLSWAAGGGHEGIVKLLLERKDIKPDIPDTWRGQPPLSWAVENSYEGIVKLLLERKDVNPNIPETVLGRTPLSRAARNGHEGIVRLLLERKGVNPDIPDTEFGRTPLSWAAENGHEEIVKLLLGREDVNPDSSDKYDRTPLFWAAWNGQEGVVQQLLGRGDVSPDQPNQTTGAKHLFAVLPCVGMLEL